MFFIIKTSTGKTRINALAFNNVISKIYSYFTTAHIANFMFRDNHSRSPSFLLHSEQTVSAPPTLSMIDFGFGFDQTITGSSPGILNNDCFSRIACPFPGYKKIRLFAGSFRRFRLQMMNKSYIYAYIISNYPTIIFYSVLCLTIFFHQPN